MNPRSRLAAPLALLLVLAGPASAQLRRAAAGYQLTAGSDGYIAHEGRIDGSGRAADWLGFYGGGSYIADEVYRWVWWGAGGLEFHVGDEDRLRFGGHIAEGRFLGAPGGLEANGVEVGYLTQLARFHSLGFFYRFTTGTMVPIGSVRASASFPGGAMLPGRRETTLRTSLKTRPLFQTHEFTTAGSFDLTESDRREGMYLDLAITGVIISNIEPAVSESASLSFPIAGPVYATIAGALEQSGTLGSLQFGSVGLFLLFGGTR